jgi:SP family sugar:H+ symporter-like MFS transporter
MDSTTRAIINKDNAELSSGSNDSDVELAKDKKDQEATTPLKTKPFIVLVACCAALGGLIFGYDIAGAGATFVMDGFQEHFGWECAVDSIDCTPATEGEKDRDKGLINGLFGVGATIGAIMNPYIAEKYGRRPCLTLSNCVFILGASIQTYSPEMWVMWIGRVFSGMGVGMLSMCVPIYITECAPEHVRGVLGTLWQIAVTSGILIASAANLGLKNWSDGWRLSYGGNILFSLLFLGCLLFMPESPRWLAANADDDRLKESLAKLRYEEEIESEVQKLKKEVEEDRAIGVATWSEVFSNDNNMRWRLALGCSFQGFQQLCGINAIMFYAPDILNTFFTESEAIYGTFGLNGINFLATFITVFTVDKYGRVKLLLVGGVIMAFALVANAIMSSIDQSKTVGIMVLTFASLFIIGFAFSWGPVVWLVCSEMFPYRHRGKATGLTTMTNWGFTTIMGGVFPIASSASLSGCFGFFAVMITIGTTVVYFFQPETAKKTSLEIDESYKNHKPQLKRKVW